MKIQRTENHGTVLSLTEEDIESNAEKIYQKIRGYRFNLMIVPDGWKEKIRLIELFYLIKPALFVGSKQVAEIIEA